MRDPQDFEYDLALSYAGEDRKYVEEVASSLTVAGVRLFYDKYENVKLWGKDLYTHLHDVYQNRAAFTVMFVSEHYGRKLWTNHERRAAQARAFLETPDKEYILPVRFDDTDIPGLPATIGFIDLRSVNPSELAEMILRKLGRTPSAPKAPSSTMSKREIISLLTKIQGKQALLSQCIAEAIQLASDANDSDFMQFCTNELTGYPSDMQMDEHFLAYRSVQAFCTTDALNPRVFGQLGVSTVFALIAKNPKFWQSRMPFTSAISELELMVQQSGPEKYLTVDLPMRAFNPDTDTPDAKIWCYATGISAAELLEGVRRELTKRLMWLLQSAP